MTPRIYYYEIRARANREEREREGGAGVENGGEKRADFGGAPPTFSGFSFFFFCPSNSGPPLFPFIFPSTTKKKRKEKRKREREKKKRSSLLCALKGRKGPAGSAARSLARSVGRFGAKRKEPIIKR